jgi:acetate kinase
VVHGGPHLTAHTLITTEVKQTLRDAVPFAPLHLPQALELLDQAQQIFSNVPHYACLDTAFHQTMPTRATHLALPKHYADEGLVRYGFHGLSYESIVSTLGGDLPPRLVVAHLGSGASLCAIRDGRSIDTTMGLTPTGGIPMATRTGDLDPGVSVYLMRTGSLDADALEHLINHESGLKGLSDSNDDMQTLLQRNDADAELAIDIFCTSVRKTIGAYAALMGGLDRVVFTGGIGEHAQSVRERICDGLEFLDVQFEVIETQEERQIARHCRALLAGTAG